MHKLQLLGLALVFALGVFACNAQAQDSRYRLAYSQKLGLEVFADAPAGQWCSEALHLRIYAKQDDIFDSAAFSNLMLKLGRIITRQCPAALAASVDGYGPGRKLVYRAVASANSGWVMRRKDILQKSGTINPNVSRVYRHFTVNGWAPPKLGSAIEIVGENVNEHILTTEDNKCAIRYGRDKTVQEMQNWHITVKGNPCHGTFLQGKAAVRVLNDKGKIDGEGTGYFTDGYFTLEQRWDVMFLRRYAFGKNHQRISFLVDSDPDSGIYFIGYLRSEYRPKFEKYTQWHGCDPFMISAVTENKNLFLDESKILDLVKKAGQSADIFCPSSDTMALFAASKPHGVTGIDRPEDEVENYNWKEDPDFYFGAVIKRDPKTKEWTYTPDLAKNPVRIQQMVQQAEKRREWEIIASEYRKLKSSTMPEKLAYLHGVEKLDILQNRIASSLVSEKPVKTSAMVRINKIKGPLRLVNWPVSIVIEDPENLIKQAGWYIVSGTLRAFEPPLSPATPSRGQLTANHVTSCKFEQCGEISDIINLVRERHSNPGWDPDKPPGGVQ